MAAPGDIALRMIISAQVGEALSGIAGLGSALMKINPAVAIGAAVGAAILGIGVAAVKAAGDYQQLTTTLVTSAGESIGNLEMIRKGILAISVETGTSTDQLGKAMYFIESAGFHGADALKLETAAAKGAKSENADLATVAKALTTIMTDYHMAASQSAQAMNGLIATVQNGKTTLQELAASMGAVLPIASALHISFPQVAGAMDTMTNAGMSSRQAAMNLAHVLVALSAPSGVAVKSMLAVGLSADEVKNALVNRGLPQALQMIEDQVGKKFPQGSVAYETALKNILGGLVGFKLAAMLTGQSLGETEQNIAKVTAAMKTNGDAVLGWDLIQGNMNFQLDRAKAAIEALLIVIGQKLLPILTPVIKAFADMVAGLANLISGAGKAGGALGDIIAKGAALIDFFKKNRDAADALAAAIVGLAAALLAAAMPAILAFLASIPALIAGTIAWAAALWTAAAAALVIAAPFIAIGLVVAAVVFGILEAIQHWGEITQWLHDRWSDFSSWFQTTMHNIGDWVATAWGHIKQVTEQSSNETLSNWKTFGNNLLASAFPPITGIVNLWKWLYDHNYYFKAAVDNATAGVSIALKDLGNLWQNYVSWQVGKWNDMVQAASTAWSHLKSLIGQAAQDIITDQENRWNAMAAWFANIWQTIADSVTHAWQNISTTIAGAWDKYIAGPFNAFWAKVTGWWNTNVVHGAQHLGENLSKAIAQGVTNAGGAIGQAIHDAIASALSFLGFHDIPGFASGVQNFAGGWAVVGERGPELLFLPSGASVMPSTQGTPQAAPSGGGYSHANITLVVDGRALAQVVGVELAREIRIQGGLRNR